jgi:hypothetical protein
LLISGKPVDTTVSREDNQLIISSTNMKAVISGRHSDGSVAALDSDGNIRLKEGDQLIVDASGFSPDSELQVWLFSTPRKLGSATVQSTGKSTSAFIVPAGVETGKHGVVLSGVNPLDEQAIFSVGIMIGKDGGVSTVGKVLIAFPLVTAIAIALIIPARRRRQTINPVQ